jgi:Flp pilus assembly protein TadG
MIGPRWLVRLPENRDLPTTGAKWQAVAGPTGIAKDRAGRRKRRAGAVFSLELLLVLPILLTVCFGVVELSMLLMGMQRVQAASCAACRIGTLPASDLVEQDQAMRQAAAYALGTVAMSDTFEMRSQIGQYAGDPVVVEVTAPMSAAAPDLLKIIGFSLQGREMTAQTRMCKQ